MRQLFMETGLNPVQAGGTSAGWVSGNPAGLPLSTNVNIAFDLGPNWAEYQRLQVNMYLPVGGSLNIQMQPGGSDLPVYDPSRRLPFANQATDSTGSYIQNTSTNTSKTFTLLPFGRFVIFIYSNADAVNATVAGTKVTLQALQF